MTQAVIVVNKAKEEENATQCFNVKLAFKPLIPIGHESLSSAHPQLNAQLVTDLGLLLESYLRNKAEAVIKQQQTLADTIREVDFATAYLSNTVISEKQKRIGKVIESFQKLTEIETLVKKCEEDMKSCTQRLHLLNDFLPVHLKLESCDLKS